jgi:hypothetical protein
MQPAAILIAGAELPITLQGAGVAQWQSRSFPSLRRGFDSLHPLQPGQRERAQRGSLTFKRAGCWLGLQSRCSAGAERISRQTLENLAASANGRSTLSIWTRSFNCRSKSHRSSPSIGSMAGAPSRVAPLIASSLNVAAPSAAGKPPPLLFDDRNVRSALAQKLVGAGISGDGVWTPHAVDCGAARPLRPGRQAGEGASHPEAKVG